MNRQWNILDWNVRGINSQARWDDLRLRTEESNCGIICIQETKREDIELAYIRNFCHRRFNTYAFTPSDGNSGRLITRWNGNLFTSRLISQSRFQITMEFICNISRTNGFSPIYMALLIMSTEMSLLTSSLILTHPK
jgi:exonuclease III